MNDYRTKIIANEKIAPGINRMSFDVNWNDCVPGQFLMLSVPGDEVFLRRPFGIADLSDGKAEIFYKVVGRGTTALSNATAGTEISVLGPLGRGFSRVTSHGSRVTILVAGGYGLAPMVGFAKRLLESNEKFSLYFGGKSSDDMFFVEELKKMGIDVRIATEDGSMGEKGLVTQLLEKDLGDVENPAIYVCGPDGLLNAMTKIARKNDCFCEVSREAYMACGLGVCLGCVCRDKEGNYVRTCKEGPVFNVNELE